MNAEDIKDNNYIQMQITFIENEFYIRHASGSFIYFFFSLNPQTNIQGRH